MSFNRVVGEMVRVSAEVTNVADQPVDPDVLQLKVKTPAGVVTVLAWPASAQIVRVSPGVFYADIALTEAGSWGFRFESEAPLMGATERTLTVKKSLFA